MEGAVQPFKSWNGAINVAIMLKESIFEQAHRLRKGVSSEFYKELIPNCVELAVERK